MVGLESLCWQFGKTPPGWLDRPPFWSAGGIDLQLISAIKNAWLGKSRDVQELQAGSLKQRQLHEELVRTALAKAYGRASERFDRLVEWARYWDQALNDRHGLAAGLLHERELIWQVGDRMRREGLLERAEDIMVLRRSDIEMIAQTADLQAARITYIERLREFRRNRRLTPAPALGAPQMANEPKAPPTERLKEVGADENVLRGQGFGGGIATGYARKIYSLSDANVLESLGPNDILILPHETAFHYADWHSLLMVVKAVVTPGRPSHHLAQVARECGVPLVGHVVGDLDTIPEGMMVRVDGSNGLVAAS
jgi:phosphohistidine swiveling domain-containing protein